MSQYRLKREIAWSLDVTQTWQPIRNANNGFLDLEHINCEEIVKKYNIRHNYQ